MYENDVAFCASKSMDTSLGSPGSAAISVLTPSFPFSPITLVGVSNTALVGSPIYQQTHSQSQPVKVPSPLVSPDKLPDIKASRNRSAPNGLCSICNDRVTGRHYGAPSCDGCKGFFRRTVRRSQKYVCRFTKQCNIDKAKRNACRYCRYNKCILAGMKTEAVQSERDKIKPNTAESSSNSSEIKIQHGQSPELVASIMHAEKICLQIRGTAMKDSEFAAEPSSGHNRRLATVTDIGEEMRQHLLLLVEWSKAIPVFFRLELDDQIALLRAYSAQHLLMSLARRSMPFKDTLVISDDSCILRQHISQHGKDRGFQTPTDVLLINSHVFARILDELIEPMKLLELDDTEFVYLKSIVFFNPSCHGLKEKATINEARQSLLSELKRYITSKGPSDTNRLGNILLLSSPLQGVAQLMVESLQVASQYGLFNIDNLLQEMLLNNNDAAELLSKFTKPSQRVPVLTQNIATNRRLSDRDQEDITDRNLTTIQTFENPINYSLDKS